MTGEKLDVFWHEWQALLCAEFDSRMTTVNAKQYGNFEARKKFSAIFLLPEGFPGPSSEILAAVIEYIKENEISNRGENRQLDTIAMAGHTFGMVENNADLRQYLQDAQKLLKPHGQIIFTSIAWFEDEAKQNLSFSYKQFQQANLVGPFFNLQSFKPDGLKNQAAAANWNCEFLFRREESNYCARLMQQGF